METTTLESVKGPAKHWYLKLFLGIIFIIVGIWVLVTPVSAYIALSLLFGISFLVTGILQITYATSNRKVLAHWGWTLAIGILELLVGILLLVNPEISMVVLPLYVGFVLLFRSITALGWAFLLHKLQIKYWEWVLAIGILGLMFSFVLLWDLLLTALIIVIITGIAFLLTGITHIILSFRLRRWNKRYKQISKEAFKDGK
jgi:uncharacterized membrane protein HdeD (DUF308 family)